MKRSDFEVGGIVIENTKHDLDNQKKALWQRIAAHLSEQDVDRLKMLVEKRCRLDSHRLVTAENWEMTKKLKSGALSDMTKTEVTGRFDGSPWLSCGMYEFSWGTVEEGKMYWDGMEFFTLAIKYRVGHLYARCIDTFSGVSQAAAELIFDELIKDCGAIVSCSSSGRMSFYMDMKMIGEYREWFADQYLVRVLPEIQSLMNMWDAMFEFYPAVGYLLRDENAAKAHELPPYVLNHNTILIPPLVAIAGAELEEEEEGLF